ncbi:Txe/YoeB family addiction module toxin [bacterium]|nr:MAG: Txe/YoeB family addiction module toxin [bacterium]
MELELTDVEKRRHKVFIKSGQVHIVRKIEKLLTAVKENPFEGIGKPEQLRHQYSGKWARRINGEHRMVYAVDENLITIYSLRGHYN